MSDTSSALLQSVAERILVAHLAADGRSGAIRTEGRASLGGPGVDITYPWRGGSRPVKVKPDPYFGTDEVKIRDRNLPFYRAVSGEYAFEAIADAKTRQPGWIFNSDADELYYYYLAINQSEDELSALLNENDQVLLGELKIDRDELRILPMRELRVWFQKHFEDYTPRPVTAGLHSSWYRLIPQSDIERAVPGVQVIGSIFARLAR